MNKENLFSFFNARFIAVSRPLREQILCAMIRVNYGTSWNGDLDLLNNFFPEWYQRNLVMGGLTHLIEALSPSSEEATDPGITLEEPTLSDINQSLSKESSPRERKHTTSLKFNLS